MKPSKMTVYELFETQRRYVVPLFQRPYVWERERQWEPLWEDISVKAGQVFDQGTDKHNLSSHFLGAAVLHSIPVFGKQVRALQIIDGQQRLTTLQILLLALRDFSQFVGFESIARDLARLTVNDSRMEQPYEKYKVWPTTADQVVFEEIYSASAPHILSQKYPLVRIKYSNRFAPRPRLVEAYLYFYQAIEQYVLDTYDDDETVPLKVDSLTTEQEERIEALLETLQKYLELVVIELEERDDPQIIFETLNARGVPLLPSDLIRNYVFLEASSNGENAEELYDALWKPYDINDSFWQKEERQGRLLRPRIDLFMFHYLTFKTESVLNINQLFDAFRNWWQSPIGKRSARQQLEEIQAYSKLYESFFNSLGRSRLGVFVRRLQILDTSTIYPLLLFLYGERTDIDPVELDGILEDLESYLVRRLLCRLTAQNYNRFFVSLLKQLRKEPVITRQFVQNYLLTSQSAAARFPTDGEFHQAWCLPVYGVVTQGRLSMILEALDLAMENKKQEQILITQKLTIEHVRPRNPASEHDWPSLPETQTGIIHTLGNLTLLTGALNTIISNGSFAKKRPEIAKQSRLRLNTYFQNFSDSDVWGVPEIQARTDTLFEFAKAIWPYPESSPHILQPIPVQIGAAEQVATVIAEKEAPDDEIYSTLQQVAREERTIPYLEIAHKVGLSMEDQQDRDELGRILDGISEYEHEQGRPLLSIVVSFTEEGFPSTSFYDLANRLGKFTGQTETERQTFSQTELKAAHDYWKSTIGK